MQPLLLISILIRSAMLAEVILKGNEFHNSLLISTMSLKVHVLTKHVSIRVCGSDEGLRSTPTKYVGVKKIEPLTIDELNEYVIKLLLRYKDQPKISFVTIL